jgi:hypothetical protein
MARMAAFRFTALDDPALTEEVQRHIGARRFAYNRCLETVKDKLNERRTRPPRHQRGRQPRRLGRGRALFGHPGSGPRRTGPGHQSLWREERWPSPR